MNMCMGGRVFELPITDAGFHYPLDKAGCLGWYAYTIPALPDWGAARSQLAGCKAEAEDIAESMRARSAVLESELIAMEMTTTEAIADLANQLERVTSEMAEGGRHHYTTFFDTVLPL